MGNGTSIDMAIVGMSCAACAARIEKELNQLEGVQASVNYATEHAHVVVADDTTNVAAVINTVRDLGYDAVLPVTDPSTSTPASPFPVDAAATRLAALQQRLAVSTLLSIPVVLLAMIPAAQFRNWQWLSLALAAPVATWGAWPFHRTAAKNVIHRAATMDTLISVGVLAAFGWSLYALFVGDAGIAGMKMRGGWRLARDAHAGDIYLEASSAVTVFLLAGRVFEARAKLRAGAALRSLLALGAAEVHVIDDAGDWRGGEHTIPIGELRVGMVFAVRPGEKVATDGEVVEGHSAIDASMVTGESVPVEVSPGDSVTGATVNVGGHLRVRATRVGNDTALAQIARLVTAAQSGKAPVQRLADRIALVFVPAVVVIALSTLIGWLVAGASTAEAFASAVAVLIIACRCALGLATPTALLVGTGRGAQLGIVIKGPEILESTRRVDTVILDKTGTITTGVMTVVDLVVAEGFDPATVGALAGAVEMRSEHPIGRAIAAYADRLGPMQHAVADFRSTAGVGVEAVVDGRHVRVGRGMDAGSLTLARDRATARGASTIVVAVDGVVAGLFEVADSIKATSREAVAHLRSLGLTPMLLTGDMAATARTVADAVGIDRVIADVLPADKVAAVAQLQREGHVVAMIGDGVNDAAALAQADLGIAMGTGSDVAIEASDLTLIRGDLLAAGDAIRLSRRTLHIIKANLFWAFAYNAAAIPLAVAGLLNPMIAGGAMVLSSVFVVSNSLRLTRFR